MNFLKTYRRYLIVLIIIIILVIFVLVKVKLNNSEEEVIEDNIVEEIYDIVEEEEEIVNKVFVDVKGAVVNPGVYEIEDTKKVIDVINLAGGLKDGADTSLINLAKKVTDEMVVIIYTEEQVKEASLESNSMVKPIDTVCECPEITNDGCINQNNTSENSSTSDDNDVLTGKINLNTATMEELQTLSGIGESKAQAIIDYREENGDFQSIEEIKNVSGIGDALYEKIKDNITV